MKKLQLGSCVYWVSSNGREHPYFVITKPFGDPPSVLAVNITDFDKCPDKTVELDSGHAAIKKKSAVFYKGIEIWLVQKIEDEMNDGEKQTQPHHSEPVCSPEFLKILQEGLMKSPYTAMKYKRFCAQLFRC